MAIKQPPDPHSIEFVQGILDTLREPFLVLDRELRIISASRSFYSFFQVTHEVTEGVRIFEIGNGQWDIPELRNLLEKIIPTSSTIEAFEVSHEFPIIGDKTLLLNAREVYSSKSHSEFILLAFEDITDRTIYEAKLQKLALTDPLTGLANRNRFNSALEKTLQSGRRFKYGTALLMVDLDKFKVVNDTFGHPIGDALLKRVSDLLSDNLREVDLVARLGGDEFAVVLEGMDNKGDAELLAQRYVKNISSPFKIDEHRVSIGVSVGIALFPADADNTVDLIRRADLALYKAKEIGNTFRMFSTELED